MGSVSSMLPLLLALAAGDPARAMSLLDYVARDYRVAVGPGGELLSEQEWREQSIFARGAASELRAAGDAELAAAVDALAGTVDSRAPVMRVSAAARQLTQRVAQRFQLVLLPPRQPDARRGRALYRQACAACHGTDGTPRVEQLALPTRPTAFSSRAETARLSPRSIYQSVTYGMPATAMPEFGDALDPAARWDIAFYALQLARPDPRERARGEEILKRFPRRPDWLQLAVRSDEQLVAALRGLTQSDREAVLAAVRSSWIAPGAVTAAQ